MRLLFTATIFIGSFLLFLIQPMAAKLILPSFGGAQAVWSTTLVFFQGTLLLGYAYAHFAPKWIRGRRFAYLHLVLVAIAVAVTLASSLGTKVKGLDPSSSSSSPTVTLLLFLASSVGIPYLLVSTGAPLLQRWFSQTRDPAAKDPYFLYAASNIGSLLGLLAYPFFIESRLTLLQQAGLWTGGLVVLAVLIAACVFAPRDSADQEEIEPAPGPSRSQQRRWIVLSAVPSSMLLGVTTYLTTNIASIPLLWVVPLSLYLVTFIFAFKAGLRVRSARVWRLVAILMIPMAIVLALESTYPFLPLAALHLIVFFVGSFACHRELCETRPHPSHLAHFYLLMSVGGVLGGVFNALIAPLIFRSLVEYPLALVLLILLPIANSKSTAREFVWGLVPGAFALCLGAWALRSHMPPTWVRTLTVYGLPVLICFLMIDRPLRYAAAVGGFLVAIGSLGISSGGNVVRVERSFYGVHRVIESRNGRFRSLLHGVTIHGRSSIEPGRSLVPLTYYYKSSPIGRYLAATQVNSPKMDVALVGLGIGAIASYARPGDNYTYFELDPAVIKLASDSTLFKFVHGCKGNLKIVEGDARLTLRHAKPDSLDLIVLDAFSSDAIPLHLITLEAIREYLSKLKPDGVLAFHISNRFLDLGRILAGAADELGLVGRLGDDTDMTDDEEREGKSVSRWFFLSRTDEAFVPFRKSPFLTTIDDQPRLKPWTDDRSNLLDAWDFNLGGNR